MERIVSTQNPKIKRAVRLREPRHRKKSGWTLIDGVRELRYAVEAGAALETVFFSEGGLHSTSPAAELFVELQERFDSRIFVQVPDGLFEKIAFGDRHSQVLAIAKPTIRPLSSFSLEAPGFVLVLDQVEKPGNVGAVLRTADAVGVQAVFLSDSKCDPFNPNAIRASQGSIFTVPLYFGSMEEVHEVLTRNQFTIFTACVDGSELYCDVAYQKNVALVLGNEANGLGENWRRPSSVPIRLPMEGTMDSLNVSVTAGILAYEVWRQRRASPVLH